LKKTLVLIAILSLTLWSASHALVGFGVRAGLGSYGNGSSQSGLLLGGHIDFTALPMIGLEASGTYWSKSKDTTATITGTNYTIKSSVNLISLEGTAKYKISLPGSPLTPYIGAGPGLYFAKATGEYSPVPPPPLQAKTETSDSKFGIHFAAGANLKLPTMPISFGVQGKYALIFSDPGSHMLSIVGLMTYNF